MEFARTTTKTLSLSQLNKHGLKYYPNRIFTWSALLEERRTKKQLAAICFFFFFAVRLRPQRTISLSIYLSSCLPNSDNGFQRDSSAFFGQVLAINYCVLNQAEISDSW